MHECIVKITGVTPYSQSKYIQVEKEKRETSADHEKRVWRERMHIDDEGIAFIPLMAIKNCLSEAAKYLQMQIPGKGKSTYTKHFEAGLIVENHIPLNIKKEDVPGEWLHVPSDGRRGGTKRVLKCFPLFKEWGGEVTFRILDDAITQEVFDFHIREAGKFIGLGRFRPRQNGYYGRFNAEIVSWK